MKKAYEIASEVSRKVAQRNKQQFDKRAGAATLSEGDRVLVRNLREKGGPGKLRAQWEGKVYLVKERRGDGPVYVVQSEKGGEERVLHRNHLLPIGANVRMEEFEGPKEKQNEKVDKKKAGKSKDRPKKEKVEDQKEAEVSDEEVEEESSEGSTSDEDEIMRREVKKRRRRRRKKPDFLIYDRMGCPGQVNRVFTPHSIQNNKTTTYSNEQNNKFTPHKNKLQNTNNHTQTCQTNTSKQNILSTKQTNNSHHSNNTIPQQTNNTIQPQTYQPQYNNLWNADRCHQQHGWSMEQSFLVQMLEQQQVLTSMMFSVMFGGNQQQ